MKVGGFQALTAKTSSSFERHTAKTSPPAPPSSSPLPSLTNPCAGHPSRQDHVSISTSRTLKALVIWVETRVGRAHGAMGGGREQLDGGLRLHRRMGDHRDTKPWHQMNLRWSSNCTMKAYRAEDHPSDRGFLACLPVETSQNSSSPEASLLWRTDPSRLKSKDLTFPPCPRHTAYRR